MALQASAAGASFARPRRRSMGRDDDQHALDHGGEKLRLPVSVGMIGIGGTGGEAKRRDAIR
jgi:hypothetical protein